MLAKFPINKRLKVKRFGNCSERFLKQFNSRIVFFFHQVESHVVKIMINNNNNDDDE